MVKHDANANKRFICLEPGTPRGISAATPRYESSWYDPLNGLMCHVYPLLRRFMVKPQAKIRPTLRASLEARGIPYDDDADSSIDSIGEEVIPTAAIGREQDLGEPDFIVVKMSSTGAIGEDIPILVMEVKREDDRSGFRSNAQLTRYLYSLAQKNIHANFKGVLVIGSISYIYDQPDANSPAVCTDVVETATGLKAVLEDEANRFWANT